MITTFRFHPFRIPAALSLSVPMLVSGQDFLIHQFEKTHLEEKFYGEGAGFGDFNRDGVNDIVSGPFWYAGPDFKKVHRYSDDKAYDPLGYSNNFTAYGEDINADGWQDIVVIGFPGKETLWFKNPKNAEGLWEKHVALSVTDNESPMLVDMNNDGRLDLVCNSDGFFGYATYDPSNPEAEWYFHKISPKGPWQRFTHGIGTGDVNRDGRMDLLEKDGWWENPGTEEGDPVWKKHDVNFSGPGGAHMYAYDVDGDGDNDVITSLAAHGYGLAWYENQPAADGGITFEQHLILNPRAEPNEYGVSFSQLHAIDLADINQDGLLDIVTGKRYWAHGPNGDPEPQNAPVVYWFELQRNSDGTVDYLPHLIDDDSGVGTQVLAARINGDKWPDVLIGNKKGTYILLQDPKKVSEEEWKAVQPRKAEKQATAFPTRDGIVPKNNEGRALNLGFETGDLTDWTATSGNAWVGQPMRGDTVAARRADMASAHDGGYWLGGYEVGGDDPMGILISVSFRVTHPFASFLVGGGPHENTRVELVEKGASEAFFKVSGYENEALRPVVVDLTDRLGKEIFIRIVDRQTGHWGHINYDDFKFHETRPKFDNELDPKANKSPLAFPVDQYKYDGTDPKSSLEAVVVPEGFEVKLFAAEPDVRQPIAFAIDDRERIWVVEAYSYPQREPEGQGKDRILIFEDTNKDGEFDTRKIFMEGLNLVSGIQVGFGGVWVGAAPYFMFIPDRDGDDKPDSEPQILLDGWGYQDTHETLNAFIWGPDGWLYGCHGVFTHSRVGKPGTPDAERIPLNAGVWRYHPTRHVFEVFAEGTSNPWGVDFNDHGDCFITACVIPHLYHMIQGGRYQRQGGRHFNPYIYDDIKTIADHLHYVGNRGPHAGNNRSDSAGGGHAHAGAMVYLGGTWPEKYRNSLFMNNIHGARINVDRPTPQGSGYVGQHDKDFLLANDKASQIIYLTYGPSGSVYFIDWYDRNQCHHGNEEGHDRSNGRIYKVVHENDTDTVGLNLKTESSARLVEYQLSDQEWYVRHARRILMERGPDPKVHDQLKYILSTHPEATKRLRALWALHVTHGTNESMLVELLRDAAPTVRAWAIRLLVESGDPGSTALAEFSRLAREEQEASVRLSLISAMQRVSLENRWDVLSGLHSRADDQSDHNIPLMAWYASEPLAMQNAPRALELALSSKLDRNLEFMARRIAAIGTPEAIDTLVAGLGKTEAPTQQLAILEGIVEALKGQRSAPMPPSWPGVAAGLAQSSNERVRSLASSLSLTFGSEEALANLRKTLLDSSATMSSRKAALDALRAAKDPKLATTLIGLLNESELRREALRALGDYDDSKIPKAILKKYSQWSAAEKRDALATLVSRKSYAQALVEAMKEGTVSTRDVSADLVRQMRKLNDAGINEAITAVWGVAQDNPEEKLKEIEKFKTMVLKEDGPEPDVAHGRLLFSQTCQQCHQLFGVGGKVGPDITGSNRADLDYILENIVTPNAVIPNDYRSTTFETEDFRVVTGIVTGQNDSAWTVLTPTETLTLPKDEIVGMTQDSTSMMPEGLLAAYSEKDVRDLIAYLASPSQTLIEATPDTAGFFFDGSTLNGWDGDENLWTVEEGVIIGKTDGLDHNEFLKSQMLVGDFRLVLQVRLIPNSENSGVQFRSEVLEDGNVKGYQADIGAGWWGKLYEEHGRALLWDQPGDEHVRDGEWNTYEILAVGHRIQTAINGKKCVDLTDEKGALRGITALQLHSGGKMEIHFRPVEFEVNPQGQLKTVQ